MPVDVRMPELSSDLTEADLVSWLVKPGDRVAKGDLICEIETEKSTVEFESPVTGTLLEIVVPEGTNAVQVGTVIARFEVSESAETAETAETAESAEAPEAPEAPEEPEEPVEPSSHIIRLNGMVVMAAARPGPGGA